METRCGRSWKLEPRIVREGELLDARVRNRETWRHGLGDGAQGKTVRVRGACLLTAEGTPVWCLALGLGTHKASTIQDGTQVCGAIFRRDKRHRAQGQREGQGVLRGPAVHREGRGAERGRPDVVKRRNAGERRRAARSPLFERGRHARGRQARKERKLAQAQRQGIFRLSHEGNTEAQRSQRGRSGEGAGTQAAARDAARHEMAGRT
ncbi:hypothetical protein ERJ75_001077900 [Trypanosoma vivax]|nr:hypothetical protein ERJ75_001077900 [Trypanosoma vivax]